VYLRGARLRIREVEGSTKQVALKLGRCFVPGHVRSAACSARWSEDFETDVGVTCGWTIRHSENHLLKLWNSCIRECFVGNYRVNNDPGLHFPSQDKVDARLPLPLVALTAKVQN